MVAKNKAIFLDRDGVINKEVNYLYRPEDFEFTFNCIDALKLLRGCGYKLFIVTNQAGIGRGFYTESDFLNLMEWMNNKLCAEGATIDDVEFCPHHPQHGLGRYKQNCNCRKPKPGMLQRLIEKHNIDVKESMMIGDKFSDLYAAEAAGIENCILVRSGHSFIDQDVPARWHVFDTLHSFAQQLNQDS